MPSLTVWMNGECVGEWGTARGGTPFFRYEREWAQSPHARPLSLSLPLTANLEIRSRIRTRFRTASTDAFDLLTAIGRDCVGAVQLLPPNEEPTGWNRIDADP